MLGGARGIARGRATFFAVATFFDVATFFVVMAMGSFFSLGESCVTQDSPGLAALEVGKTLAGENWASGKAPPSHPDDRKGMK